MANTFKHKIRIKYQLGLVENVPISIQKYWNRINFDKGEFLVLRAKKREQILNNEMNNQLNEIMQKMENPIKENRIVNDYTFARRFKSFLSDIQVNDQMGYEEKEYLLSVAEKLLKYQLKTCPESEKSYHLNCDYSAFIPE